MLKMIHLKEIDSTNNYLKRAIACSTNLLEFTTVVANFQTGGRGQRGNGWEAERGKNLLFSTLVYPREVQAKEQFLLSQLISLAVVETLELEGRGFSIKWPNDIYWNDLKIAGILIENNLLGESIQNSVVGVGLNINQKRFSSSLPNPISLSVITGKEYSILSILSSILNKFKELYQQINTVESRNSILLQYKQHLYRREGFHLFEDSNGPFEAQIMDVHLDGKIWLQDTEGNNRGYYFKEVRYLI